MGIQILELPLDHVEIIEVGSSFVQGGGGGGSVFFLDATSSGVVGGKIYDTVELISCSTDTTTITAIVGLEGGPEGYTPTVKINDVEAVVVETATKRWFTASAVVPLVVGANTLNAKSSTGAVARTTVTRLGVGPTILSASWGAYPGTQTKLKAGDTILLSITTEPEATSVTISGGSVTSSSTWPVVGGSAAGALTVGTASGSSSVVLIARNSFGTAGAPYTPPAIDLDQTAPSFGTLSVNYPGGRSALGVGESADVTCTVVNADAVTYSATGLTVDPGYTPTKSVANASTGYVASGTNYTISATRAANATSASVSTLVKIATTAATASITTPARLTGSPAGVDHEIRIYPTQALLSAPSLTASVGAWQGSWTQVGSYWKRNLRIRDSDGKNPGTFSALGMTGLAGVAGNTITAGVSYTLGGMSVRTLTFPAFSRVTALGAQVVDVTKTTASVVGGNVLVRQSSNANVANGFYIANADASYNPNGSYLGLSDAALAGANTSGSLQASFEETA